MLPMSLQGLQDHRNWFINHDCYFNYFGIHNLDLNFYICKLTSYMGNMTIHVVPFIPELLMITITKLFSR